LIFPAAVEEISETSPNPKIYDFNNFQIKLVTNERFNLKYENSY
jgi:hypothetical protein